MNVSFRLTSISYTKFTSDVLCLRTWPGKSYEQPYIQQRSPVPIVLHQILWSSLKSLRKCMKLLCGNPLENHWGVAIFRIYAKFLIKSLLSRVCNETCFSMHSEEQKWRHGICSLLRKHQNDALTWSSSLFLQWSSFEVSRFCVVTLYRDSPLSCIRKTNKSISTLVKTFCCLLILYLFRRILI